MISVLGDVEYNTVFCDWLDVTYSPDADVIPELESFLSSNDFVLDGKSSTDKNQIYRPLACRQLGTLKVEFHFRFVKVSASGALLSFLRLRDLISSYLSVLSLQPHRVTRLDLSIDVAKDFPIILHGFHSHYPDGFISFSRKKQSVREHLSHRLDGEVSGTYYIGAMKSSITARIYDKQLEMLEKFKATIPICTRYEITFKKKSTLKDASDPAPLFWKYASVLLLDYLRPKGVPEWVDGTEYIGWTFDVDVKPPYARMQRFLGDDHVLAALERISSLMPSGRACLDKLIANKLTKITAERLAKLSAKGASNDND